MSEGSGRRKARAVRELSTTRSPVSEERWESITAAARRCFAEHGYDAASLADIAALSGLSKGALYYYIDSKEGLLFALMSRRLARRVNLLHEPLSLAVAGADVRLRSFIGRWVTDSMEDGEWAVVSERGLARLTEEHRQSILAQRSKVEHYLEEVVQQGIDDGVFSSRLTPRLAAEMVLGLLRSVADAPVAARSADEVADLYATFVISGLAASPIARTAPATAR